MLGIARSGLHYATGPGCVARLFRVTVVSKNEKKSAANFGAGNRSEASGTSQACDCGRPDEASRQVFGVRRSLRAEFGRAAMLGLPASEDQRMA